MGLFSSCEHDWTHDTEEISNGFWSASYHSYADFHECTKCGKKEKCQYVQVYEKSSAGVYWYTNRCNVCNSQPIDPFD